MKKLIALLLAVFMLLSGCAAGTTTIKEEKALSELGEGKREESVAVVNVTINPEFELYLDIDFNVTKVRCLNEDAVTTLEAVQTDLVGNKYGPAMFSILDAATQAGFLAPDAQVKIETTLHTPMDEAFLQSFAEEMANPVKVFSKDNGLSLAVESVTPTVDEKAAEAFMEYYKSNPPTTDQSFVVNGNEASGDLYDENGNKVGTFLDVYDVYGPEGHLLKSERFYDDGTYDIYEYYSNGNMSRWEYSMADGSSGEQTYYANGSLKSDTANLADGSVYVTTYYANGNASMTISDSPDGEYLESYYTEDGNMYMCVSLGPNGERNEDYYAEDGTYLWNIGPANGTRVQTVYGNTIGTCTQYFDENGYLYKAVSEFKDGTKDETTYYPNGNQKSVLGLSPYGSSYMYYNEDGTLAPNRGEPNSVIELGNETKYYDENGALYKEVLVRQDGSVMETTYYPNGNRKSVYDNDPDNPGYWFFEEDGSEKPFNKGEPNLIAPITCYSPDDQKGIMTRYFDEEGLLYKEIQEYPDGTSLEIGYSKGGNQTYSISEGPDGHSEWHYNLTVSGQLTKYIADTAEEYYEVHYYQNGKMSLQISWDKETGYYYEAHYNQDGNIISEHSETR